MRSISKHSAKITALSNSNTIILLSTFVSVLLVTPTATTRFREYGQQWMFSRNTEPDWKIQYNTTTGAPIVATDRNKQVVNVIQGHNSEGGGTEIKTRQNNKTNIYWEIIVDNAGGRRNVSGVRRGEMGGAVDKRLPGINTSDVRDTAEDQMQAGHVGVKIHVSGDEKDKRHMEQEPAMSRGMKEVFEQFYEVAGYFSELLDYEGKVIFV
jgi:hypothetical protein